IPGGSRTDVDFSSFEEIAYEDADFMLLFQGSWDGIEESEIGEALGMANLRFQDWFKPFNDRPEYRVHPFLDDPSAKATPLGRAGTAGRSRKSPSSRRTSKPLPSNPKPTRPKPAK